MADFPYMPHYPSDYVADTRHPSLDQHGAYRLLLDHAWLEKDCWLPDDDAMIARILGVTKTRWLRSLKPAVMAFWSLENGRWTQKRQRKERQKLEQKSAKARDSAERRWRRNQLNEQEPDDAFAYANASAEHGKRIYTRARNQSQSHIQNSPSSSTVPTNGNPRTKPIDDDEWINTVAEFAEEHGLTDDQHDDFLLWTVSKMRTRTKRALANALKRWEQSQ